MHDGPSYKASLTLPRRSAETIATALSELFWPPAETIGLFDNGDGAWRVEATFRELPEQASLKDFLHRQGLSNVSVSLEKVPDADWVAISQAGLHPVRAGRFLIHGSHDRARIQRNRWAIEIDAACAFGTAHHESTVGCLMAIDDLARREAVKAALDIGTGTGILAIAAARAWRAHVIASDIDPVAVATAKENFRRNGVLDTVACVSAYGLAHPLIRANAPFDLVIANILATPLIAMAHEIARALRPGGIVILSGITRGQAGRVTAGYCAAGFARLRQFAISEWVTLNLRRVR
ncbi:MAG: 50S ribosomal protein L11 methyltransferase [Methyloligellaceae bacterium]